MMQSRSRRPSSLFLDIENVDGRTGPLVSESGEALEVPVIVEQINTRRLNEGDIDSLE